MTLGYIILGINTRAPDWDGELHPDRDAAIESLTGPVQPYAREDNPLDERLPWYEHYTIARVEEDQ